MCSKFKINGFMKLKFTIFTFSPGIQTQKRMPKEGLNFTDNFELNHLNYSASDGRKAYGQDSSYHNYLNYSQSVSVSKRQNRHPRNIWNSMEFQNKPYINENSKRIANSKKTTNQSVHSRLHQQALAKQ
jgi:hypothetical protein